MTFADGQAEATITVTVVADRDIETNETFQVTLSNASGGMTLEVAQATAVIVNDDSPPRPVPTLGSEGDDVVVLTDAGTSYSAGGGSDLVMADGGNDSVHGNIGDDTLHGGAGDDVVHGGQGADLMYGDDGADVLLGDRADDYVHGGRGDDVIDGGEGGDILVGGQGNDVLRGSEGDDLLSGDRGDDTLVGGLGADVFRVMAGGGADVVADFEILSDRVQVVGSYSLSQAGADVLVALGGGDSLTLLNVQLVSLPAEWIFS